MPVDRLPMLRAIKQYAEEHKIVCYISLEERMACGIGACLGMCVQDKRERCTTAMCATSESVKMVRYSLSTEVEI